MEEENGLANNQPTLEQYVANRYLRDLNDAGYQPVCLNDDGMLQEAMDVLAALNQASQVIKRAVTQRRATA